MQIIQLERMVAAKKHWAGFGGSKARPTDMFAARKQHVGHIFANINEVVIDDECAALKEFEGCARRANNVTDFSNRERTIAAGAVG